MRLRRSDRDACEGAGVTSAERVSPVCPTIYLSCLLPRCSVSHVWLTSPWSVGMPRRERKRCTTANPTPTIPMSPDTIHVATLQGYSNLQRTDSSPVHRRERPRRSHRITAPPTISNQVVGSIWRICSWMMTRAVSMPEKIASKTWFIGGSRKSTHVASVVPNVQLHRILVRASVMTGRPARTGA